MTHTVEFTVTGEQTIHCASCEQRIERALRRVAGVQEVRASVENQLVVATIDGGQVAPEQLRDTLRDLGYEVTSPTSQRGAG